MPTHLDGLFFNFLRGCFADLDWHWLGEPGGVSLIRGCAGVVSILSLWGLVPGWGLASYLSTCREWCPGARIFIIVVKKLIAILGGEWGLERTSSHARGRQVSWGSRGLAGCLPEAGGFCWFRGWGLDYCLFFLYYSVLVSKILISVNFTFG